MSDEIGSVVPSPKPLPGSRLVNEGTDARRQMRTVAVSDDKTSASPPQLGDARKDFELNPKPIATPGR